MILTITFLIAAVLRPVQPTIVTTFEPTTVQGVQLSAAHPTIVKTWEVK